MRLGARTLPDAWSANAVGEVRGRERPDEVVVIGGHLDSWDVGQGAIDDGAGVVIAMETLRLLRVLDLRPRRTVRAVLFMNEENGLRGGEAYARDHAAELPRHVAAIESDTGAGPPARLLPRRGPRARASASSRSSRRLPSSAPLPSWASDGTGADLSPLEPCGVPLLGLRQDMTRYFDWHHTQADTLDKVDPRELAANAVTLAYAAWALADAPEPLPRAKRIPPLPGGFRPAGGKGVRAQAPRETPAISHAMSRFRGLLSSVCDFVEKHLRQKKEVPRTCQSVRNGSSDFSVLAGGRSARRSTGATSRRTGARCCFARWRHGRA